MYNILVMAPAEADLRGIWQHIAENLQEPAAAHKIYSVIKSQIMTLAGLPLRYPPVLDEAFAARGLRKMPAENYLIFYVVDETEKEVHILRVLYNRREWRHLL